MNDFWVFVRNDIVEANLLENSMFEDMFRDGSVTCQIQEDSRDRLAEFLARRKIQKITGGAVNIFLANRYELEKCIRKNAAAYDNIYVFFLNTAFTTVRYPVKVLKSYKKKWPNVRYVLYYLDPIGRGVSQYAKHLQENGVFDLVYTFDSYDAKKYDLIWWKTPCSRMQGYGTAIVRDLYFIGVETERAEQIFAVLKKGKENGVQVQMDVIPDGDVSSYSEFSQEVTLHSKTDIIPYTEALRRTLEAGCILELVRPKQAGLTLRPYEAVLYNRKLLTNNKSILNFEYYNPVYMQYFEKVEDIDWQWVKDEIPVDYGYRGDFSPLLLLEDIANRLSAPERA